MSLGQIARRVLGERWFPVVGAWYRALATNVDKAAAAMPEPAPDEVILDIGGGDGELLERYLARHPRARATMIDLKPRLGIALSPASRARAELLPSTSIADYARQGRPTPTMLFVADVIHHVPPPDRHQFFADIRNLLGGKPARLVIKDVQPGSLRALYSWAVDRYVSGDRHVSLIGADAMVRVVREVFPAAQCEETPLVQRDSPNYCLIFSL